MARPAQRYHSFRSGLEEKIAKQLDEAGVPYEFEKLVLVYEVPKTQHKYTPDFHLLNSGIILETKGYFEPKDRKKHIHVRLSNPDRDIRFIFQRANTRISKASPTTYGMWATKNGFLWADKEVPKEWLH